jgi:hypothetical protein
MFKLWALIRGGFLRGYRAQALGIAAGIGGLADALAQWAVGDLSIVSLIRALSENWALIAGGFGVATLGPRSTGRTPAPRNPAKPFPTSPAAPSGADRAAPALVRAFP